MTDNELELMSLGTELQLETGAFPLVLAGHGVEAATMHGGVDAVDAWVAARRDDIDTLLGVHGAILFRGFPIASAEGFDRFVQAFDYPSFRYEDSPSSTLRVDRTERVYSVDETRPDIEIPMRHELAQTPVHPSRLFLYCERPSEEAGTTPICRSDILWQRIKAELPEFAAAAEARGLLYTHVMPNGGEVDSAQGRSWRDTFLADSREAAEARMRALGYRWEWLEDGSLRATTPTLPAVRTLEDGRQVFFNQLIAEFGAREDTRNGPADPITFGDGAPLDHEAV